MKHKTVYSAVILSLLLIALAASGSRAAALHPLLPQADNPNPPAVPVKLIFIHHSTGQNWLDDDQGRLGLTLRDNNYFVSDTNYGWGPDGIGDTTDIGHWWNWFAGPDRDTYTAALYAESSQHSSYSRLATDPGGQNQIVMFKSCFPNSHLGGSPNDPPPSGDNPLRGQDAWSEYMTVGNAKGIYNDILAYFATRQDKLFVAITAPPLVESETDATHAANARAFDNWLVNDWLKNYPYHNVAVFDFYNVLTSNGGDRHTNDLDQESGNHHRWWNGAVQHIQTVNDNFAAYGSDASDSHPTPAGGQKASAEFVTLLNIFYHRWKSDTATTTPTATGKTATPASSPTFTPTVAGTPRLTATPTTVAPTATPTMEAIHGVRTLLLQNGVSPTTTYTGTTDAIITTWSGNSFANLGGLDYLQAGENGAADEFRFLVRFDLVGRLPTQAHITSAWLELYSYDGGFDDTAQDVVAHQVTQAWIEGNGRDLFADGRSQGVTWVTARPGTNWATPGGDYSATELYRRKVAANATGWQQWDVTAAVQAWQANSAANFGLLLEPDAAPWTHHEFRASEYVTPEQRPRLRVSFTLGMIYLPLIWRIVR